MRRSLGLAGAGAGILAAVALALGTHRPADSGVLAALRDSSMAAVLRIARDREAAFDLPGAIEAYAEAIRRDPLDIPTNLAYQDAKEALWEGHELAGEYREKVERSPADPTLRFLYAHAVARRNLNWRVNLALYDSASALDPRSPWPLAYRYERYGFPDPGDREEVLGTFRQCAELVPGLTACHEQLGQFALSAGDYATAEAAYARALAADPTWPSRPEIYLGLIESELNQERDDPALANLSRAFDEFEATDNIPWQFRFYSQVESRIPAAWSRLLTDAETDSALARFQRRATSGLDRLEALDIPLLADQQRVQKGPLLIRRGDQMRGLDMLSSAIADSARFPYGNRTATLRRHRCEAERSLYVLQPALEDCRSAVATFRATADSLELMRGLHQLLHAEEALGKLDEALETAEEHLLVSRRRGNDSHAVSALHDLGWMAWQAGEHDRALRALDEMAEIASGKGRWLYEVGELYENTGRYDRALEYYQRGASDTTATARRTFGNYPRSVLGLARVYLRLGDTRRALEYAREYEEYLRSVDPGSQPLPNVAEVRRAEGRYDEAIRFAEGWVDEATSRGSATLAEEARRELALSYAAAGRPDQAVEQLRSVLDNGAALERFRERGSILLKLAEAYLALGDADSASRFTELAGEHARLTRDPETAWYVELTRGRVHELRGETEEALSAYDRAVEGVEDLYGRVPTDELRTWFLGARLDPFDAAIRMRLERADPASTSAAFRLAEGKKAQALLRLARADGMRDRSAPEATRRARESAGIEVRLEAARARLRAEYERPPQDRDAGGVRALQGEIDSLTAEHASTRGALDASAASSRPGASLPTPREVRYDLLAPGEALVEYTFIDDRPIAFVVTSGATAVVRLESDAGEIGSLAGRLRAPLAALSRGELDLSQVPWDLEAATRLYEILVAPLETRLDGARSLTLVPEGVLWDVPFGALVTGAARAPERGEALFSEYEGVKFLVDAYTIRYAPSAALLDPALWRHTADAGGLLIMADPVVSTRDHPPGDGTALPVEVARQLPGTREEAASIRQVVPGAEVLFGADATEAAFRAEAPAYRVIHMATHGLLNEAMPLYSGLAMSPGPDSDGMLYAYELLDAGLVADLVVLSACETGVGELRAGEGMMALTRAFMATGVPSLIASQWVVPDEGASPLMPELYRKLSMGATTPEALRAAQLATRSTHVRVGQETVSLAHPIYWAGFVMIGRREPVELLRR